MTQFPFAPPPVNSPLTPHPIFGTVESSKNFDGDRAVNPVFLFVCTDPNINWAMVAVPETAAKAFEGLRAPTAHFVLEVATKMYLNLSTNLEEVVSYGLNPFIEFLYLFEEKHLDLHPDDPNSQETILWVEIMGKALQLRDVSKRIAK